jgi:hypothetical protein
MSVDTVIHSISNLRRRFEQDDSNSFSPEGKQKVLISLDCMRDPLMKDDIPGFDQYVDSLMRCDVDLADFILEELFNHLGITFRVQLTVVLLA